MSNLDFSIVGSIKNDKVEPYQKLQGGTVTTYCKSDESSVQLDDSFEDLGLDEYYL